MGQFDLTKPRHENIPSAPAALGIAGRLMVPFLLLLGAAIGFYALGHYDHNDHLNAVVPVVARDHRLYSDVAYDQTPLSVLVSRAIGRLVPDRDLYTVLRIYSLLLNLGVLLAGMALSRRSATDKNFAAFLFAGLYLSFGPTEVIGGEIGNYTLALFLFSLSLLCFDAPKKSTLATLATGVFAGLAVSAKLSYVFMLAAYGILYLTVARAPGHVLKRALTFCLGAFIGLAPVLYYALSDYDAFVFENIHVHYLQNVYRGLNHVAEHTNLFVFSVESAAVPLLLIGAAGLASVLLWRGARSGARSSSRLYPTGPETALLCLAAAALVGAVTPSIVFPQYLAAPAFLIFLFLALYSDRLLAALPQQTNLRLAAVSAVATLGLWRGAVVVDETAARLASGNYAITAVSAMRERLSDVIDEIDRKRPGCHGDLVSAFADLALGTGVTISPVSATGPFIMRLDSVFAERAPAFRRFSDVTRYLSPRALILSGFYNDDAYEPASAFQNVMENYARAHRFDAVRMGSFMYRPIVLYVPEACVLKK